MATMKGSRPKTHGKGKIRSMHIKPAANGFTSQVTRERPSPNGPYMNEHDEPPTIHPSVSHLAKHVKNTFAPGGPAAQGEEPDEDDQPAQA